MKQTLKQLMSFTVAFAMVFTLNILSAEAAAPQNASNNMTRQKIGETADHNFTFNMPTATAADVVITFPVGFDLASAASAGNTVNAGARTVTIAGPVTANQLFTVPVTGVVNPAVFTGPTTDTYSITIASDVDTGSVLVPIIADDQIQITARVAQTLTFDVRDGSGAANTATDNAVQFGDLEAGNTNFATDAGTGSTTTVEASQFIASTNAPGGYIVELTGETLTSMQNLANTIDAVANGTAAPAAGTEAFGLQIAKEQANTGAAVSTINANYDGSFALPATATEDVIVTQLGPSSEEIFDVTYIANIDALTEAGDYSTVMTFTMTANF